MLSSASLRGANRDLTPTRDAVATAVSLSPMTGLSVRPAGNYYVSAVVIARRWFQPFLLTVRTVESDTRRPREGTALPGRICRIRYVWRDCCRALQHLVILLWPLHSGHLLHDWTGWRHSFGRHIRHSFSLCRSADSAPG